MLTASCLTREDLPLPTAPTKPTAEGLGRPPDRRSSKTLMPVGSIVVTLGEPSFVRDLSGLYLSSVIRLTLGSCRTWKRDQALSSSRLASIDFHRSIGSYEKTEPLSLVRSPVTIHSNETAKLAIRLVQFHVNYAVEAGTDFVVERVAVDSQFYRICADVAVLFHSG